AHNAGSAPIRSDRMTPPRITSTPIAAARVSARTAASRQRSRLSAVARDDDTPISPALPRNASFTTDGLSAGCMTGTPATPRAGCSVVGQDDVEPVRLLPVGTGGSGLERGGIRRDGRAVLVEHTDRRQLVLLGIGIFDVADRALGVLHVIGNALVAFGADADR